MKTYWDYTDQERSELPEVTVIELLRVELMVAGVASPKPPVLLDVPESPLGGRKKYFGVVGKSRYGSDEFLDPVFETPEKAQAFLDMLACRRGYDYEIGTDTEYAIPITDAKIQQVELYSLDQINSFRSELKNRKAKSEANAKAQSEFTEASNKAEKVTERVWEDWNKQRQMRQSLREIVSRFSEYVGLTGGEEQTALKFLRKANSIYEIQAAREWFPGMIPELETVIDQAPEAA